MRLVALPEEIPDGTEDPSRCQLLGTTGLIVQGFMGLFVLGSLVIKRQFEIQKRPWRIWLWDVAKQLVGQAVIHGLNLLISDQLALAAHRNPCSLYFLNVLIDTTIGVGIFYFALKGWTYVFIRKLGPEGFTSGLYGNPPKPSYWWKQIMPYLLSIIFMKLLVLLPLTLPRLSTGLIHFGHSLLEYLSPSVQIIFVMALFPLIMNILQFCLVDQVIKASKKTIDEDEEEHQYQTLPTFDSGHRHSIEINGHALPKASPSSSRDIRPIPSSPLMGSTSGSPKREYGSTSPSPTRNSDSTWVKMARRRISTDTSTTSVDDDDDKLPLPRDQRSDAPSPDSSIVRQMSKSIDSDRM